MSTTPYLVAPGEPPLANNAPSPAGHQLYYKVNCGIVCSVCKKKNHNVLILIDIVIAIWVTVLVEMGIFAFHFQWKKYKNDKDVIFAGVRTKQARFFTCEECDFWAGASL